MLPIDTTGINNSQANIVLRWYRYWGRIISNGDRGAWSLMWLPWKPRANCSDGEAISHRKQNHLMGCLLAGRSNCWHLDFDRWTRMRMYSLIYSNGFPGHVFQLVIWCGVDACGGLGQPYTASIACDSFLWPGKCRHTPPGNMATQNGCRWNQKSPWLDLLKNVNRHRRRRRHRHYHYCIVCVELARPASSWLRFVSQ